jgi:hypothetical protein
MTVGAVHHLGDEMVVEDAVDGVVKPRTALEMRDVVERAGGQVVEDQHLVPGLEQRFGEMGSNEPRTTRNQDSHDVLISLGSERSLPRRPPR